MYTIRGDKYDSQDMRWLAKAQAKDADRSILTGTNKANGLMVSCDGLRLHAIPTPTALQDLPNGTFTGKIPAGDFVADLETNDGHYPDVSQVVPTGEPIQEFAINPKYLREALDGLGNHCIVRIHQRPNCITVHSVNDQHRYAVIMLQHDNGLRPYTPDFNKNGGDTE